LYFKKSARQTSSELTNLANEQLALKKLKFRIGKISGSFNDLTNLYSRVRAFRKAYMGF